MSISDSLEQLAGRVPPLFADHELAARRQRPSVRVLRETPPDAIRSVGIVGGGTAGYLTALGLRTHLPHLDVTLVEASDIPIIGVGEATIPSMVGFLHDFLQIDAAELWDVVRPTWKLGIRFDWGAPGDHEFMAPFDWSANAIGLIGSLMHTGRNTQASIESMLMTADRVPLFRTEDGSVLSFMQFLPWAYHLDNVRFVKFLTDLARVRGVAHVDATIDHAVVAPVDGEPRVDHLVTTDGRTMQFDLYVDCTGFRSLLQQKALGSPWHSFASSLYTDTAVVGWVPNDDEPKPYTLATTMNSGWCWNIGQPDEDHVGYVFSSSFCSEEEATQELQARYPRVSDLRTVRFRAGRAEHAWQGNVVAIGNSCGFVEPLESSGLLMITTAVTALVDAFPASHTDARGVRTMLNQATAKSWDDLRWFLAMHYKFNRKLDTEFWQTARREADISAVEPLLEVYAAGAPLRFRDRTTLALVNQTAPTFYGLAGIDCILLGQGVPAPLVEPPEPPEVWQARRRGVEVMVRRALSQGEALREVHASPALLEEIMSGLASRSGDGNLGAAALVAHS